MKRLAITCSIGVMLVAVAAPTASAEQAPPPPSAMERLIRQEDARWNDPRLGLAEKPAPQPSAVQRLVRQEDARANDPRLGVATGAPPSPKAPTIQIIAVNSFDWLSAGIGGIASAAALRERRVGTPPGLPLSLAHSRTRTRGVPRLGGNPPPRADHGDGA